MNMRMVVKASCVGMKDGGESRSSSELFVVSGEGLQDILDHQKHQGIDGSLVPPGKLSELARKGEGNQVVCTWQQFTKLLVNPLLALMVLAMGTVSVAA
jgi:hypothetical protein